MPPKQVLNMRPSPRFLASIASNTQPVASASSSSFSSSSATSSANNNQAAGEPKTSRRKKPALTLDQFIQRQRVLSFWREIIRAVHKIPPSSTRTEMRDYARAEFDRNRGVQDVAHIRYLLSAGKTEFDTMRRYIDELAAVNR